jgi:hypothetical protein
VSRVFAEAIRKQHDGKIFMKRGAPKGHGACCVKALVFVELHEFDYAERPFQFQIARKVSFEIVPAEFKS